MGQRLFAAVAPPALPNLNDGGTDYTLCTLFRADVDGHINGIYWYTPVDRNPTAKAGLFQRFDDLTGAEVARIDPFTVTVDGAWNYAAFAAPIAITALQWYYAAIWTPGQYVATGQFFSTGPGAAGITSANLHSPSTTLNRGNGRFFAGAADLTYPDDDFNGGFYHVDVDFTPAGGGTTVLVGQATETSTAQPLIRVKSLTLGQATTADTAAAVTRIKALTLGRALEVSTALPLGAQAHGAGPWIVSSSAPDRITSQTTGGYL